MKSFESFPCILIQRDPLDFRKGRRGIAAWVQNHMEENPFDDTLFVFFNRRRDAVKCLFWDRNGFALWEKGLEEEKFKIPRGKLPEKVVLTAEQFRWLLDGFDVWKMKPHRELSYALVS